MHCALPGCASSCWRMQPQHALGAGQRRAIANDPVQLLVGERQDRDGHARLRRPRRGEERSIAGFGAAVTAWQFVSQADGSQCAQPNRGLYTQPAAHFLSAISPEFRNAEFLAEFLAAPQECFRSLCSRPHALFARHARRRARVMRSCVERPHALTMTSVLKRMHPMPATLVFSIVELSRCRKSVGALG